MRSYSQQDKQTEKRTIMLSSKYPKLITVISGDDHLILRGEGGGGVWLGRFFLFEIFIFSIFRIKLFIFYIGQIKLFIFIFVVFSILDWSKSEGLKYFFSPSSRSKYLFSVYSGLNYLFFT